jgi:hypothetical protein
MFSPLRRREMMSPEGKVFLTLKGHEAGTIPADLADELVRAGVATGTRSLVVKRIAEILDGLEGAGKVERIPDGRYRVVRGVKGA